MEKFPKNNEIVECKFSGFVENNIKFIEDFQLLDSSLWTRFVHQFKEDADFDAGWRGEYWGKMMRGAALTYSYTKTPELYSALETTVYDILSTEDEYGRISSYDISHEFDGWDLWSRKYVMLGLMCFYDICKDNLLKDKIIESLKRQANYIMSKIGSGDGKKEITSATRHWRGLNSSSILEPIVKLYKLTENREYLEFAEYIVSCGGTDIVNIFDLAYENKLYPYQYPVTKAYEMTSCFEGLLEMYYVTNVEKYKIALINYAEKILESDFTIIGCSGCTHELFDHSSYRQSNTTNGLIMQETCVTVTLMDFFSRMTLLTGESKYIDAFEISMYNAYFGSFNTQKRINKKAIEKASTDCKLQALPFDSYSPLTAGTRGNGIGGLRVMSDNHFYGCCACIGSLGNALIPKLAVLSCKDGYTINLFINGTFTTNNAEFVIKTDYPKTGKVIIEVKSEGSFSLYIRNPYWSADTKVHLNNEEQNVTNSFITISRKWNQDDVIQLDLDMRTRAFYPVEYKQDILMNKVILGKNYMISTYDEQDPLSMYHIALLRGPIVLAQDNRLDYNVDEPVDIAVNNDGFVDAEISDKKINFDSVIAMDVPLTDKKYITLIDYASAGKTWDEESKMAAWILTKKIYKNGK